jgi:hypothetical protein
MAKQRRIDPKSDLWDAEERPIGISVPIPISRRLDQLVTLAEGTGIRVYRKDVIAALVLAASDDPEDLSKLLHRCRTAKAGEAQVKGASTAMVLELDRPKPGRRPRRT